MASIRTPAQLALRLAEIAREHAECDGDFTAQTVTYALLLSRLRAAAVGDLTCSCLNARLVSRVEMALDEADLAAVVSSYESCGMDPAIYFYQDFLRAYDPGSARSRGVHYSPPAVVSFIVRGVEQILKDSFGETLAQAFVLDPCCGIGTFLRWIEQHVPERPAMLGMELMPVPCALASRLLDCEVIQADGLDGSALDTEGRTLVVIGNPPYSGHSSNAGKVSELLADYRQGLTERNPKWLQDDYVKFMRMAQDRVERAGRGIVAFITNHSYMFNPTFRAMRESLMRDFDEIYILDLHGNAKKVEGDANVFPIQMGVAISFMVKTSGASAAKVHYAELRGTRESKLLTISNTHFDSIPWREISPAQPFSAFVPHDDRLQEEYAAFPSLFDIFRKSSVGFVTSRDWFAVDTDRDALLQRVETFRNGQIELPGLDNESARRVLLEDPEWQDRAVEALYRPFDTRWVYYSPAILERPRLPFMRNLMLDNVALAVGRAGHATGSDEWDVVFCTDRPADLNLFRRGGAMLFPRFVYENGVQQSNIGNANLDNDRLFRYIYALLHSGIYRSRYADFLAIDYARVPIVRDDAALSALAELGEQLMAVHLMRSELEPADDGAPMRVGGYEVPGKYLADRKTRELNEQELRHLGGIRAATIRKMELRRLIDEIVAACPPWVGLRPV